MPKRTPGHMFMPVVREWFEDWAICEEYDLTSIIRTNRAQEYEDWQTQAAWHGYYTAIEMMTRRALSRE